MVVPVGRIVRKKCRVERGELRVVVPSDSPELTVVASWWRYRLGAWLMYPDSHSDQQPRTTDAANLSMLVGVRDMHLELLGQAAYAASPVVGNQEVADVEVGEGARDHSSGLGRIAGSEVLDGVESGHDALSGVTVMALVDRNAR